MTSKEYGKMKTVREITKLTNNNRQAVYRYIKNHNIRSQGFTESGIRIYSDSIADEIVKNLAKKKSGVKSNATELSFLRDQLSKKDDQIAKLQQALENQQRLTAKAQQLLDDSKAELTDSREQVLRLTAEQDKQQDEQVNELKKLRQANQEQTEKLHKMSQASWFDRLFKHW